MDFLRTLHAAFFFCGRCPMPLKRREEHWISKVISGTFRLLPKEARTNPRRIYFPRGTHWEDGLRE